MKNQTTVFCFILALILPLSCQMKMSQEVNERVVIVYMIADNNLEHFAWQDINEMEEGLVPGQRLLAYVDGGSNSEPAHPVLFEIVPDKSEHIVSRIVRVWPEQDSAAPQVIGQILGSIREDFPAREYGLVFWSHGSAWLPAGYSIDLSDKDDQGIEEPSTNIRSHYNVQETKSFGLDEDLEIIGMGLLNWILRASQRPCPVPLPLSPLMSATWPPLRWPLSCPTKLTIFWHRLPKCLPMAFPTTA